MRFGVSVRTLQDWEQGRRDPTGAAQTLLRVAVKHPRILRGLAIAQAEFSQKFSTTPRCKPYFIGAASGFMLKVGFTHKTTYCP